MVTLGRSLVVAVAVGLVFLGRFPPETRQGRVRSSSVAARSIFFGIAIGFATGGAFGAWLASSLGLFHGAYLGLLASIVPTVVGGAVLSAVAYRSPDTATFAARTRTVCAVFGAGSAVVILALAARGGSNANAFISAGAASIVVCWLLLRLAAQHIPAGEQQAPPERP